MAFPVYSFEIDWSGNGTFADKGEDISARVLDSQGFTCERGRDQIRALGQPAAGPASLGSIDNQSKDYSTEYAGVPFNLVTNPSFEVDLAGWSSFGISGTSALRLGTDGAQGSACLELVFNGVSSSWGRTIPVALTPGATYTLSGYIKRTAAVGRMNIDVFEFGIIDLSGIQIASGAGTSGAWQRFSETFVYPGGGSGAAVVRVFGDSTPAGSVRFDGLQLEPGATLSAYADGGAADCRWTGAAHASVTNKGGPLYGTLLPGRRARARAVHSSTTYDLFGGIVDDVEQRPEDKQVGIPLLGTLSRLAGQNVTTGLFQGITTDVALGHILDAVGWPAGERSLQTGQTTLLWWWLDDEDAFGAIARLVNTEGPGAAAYERGDGYFVFENRHHRLLTTRCTTSQATFRDAGSAPYHTAPFEFGAQLKEVINTVSIPVNARTVQPLGQVWQLGQPLNIPASATVTIMAKASEPFVNAITPAAGTDYTVTSGSLASVTTNRLSGLTVAISLTGGASGASVTGLQLRAQLLAKTELRVASTVDVSASVATHGIKTYELAIWPEIDVNSAQDFANAIALAYREPRAIATITVAGVDDTHLTQCLAREISDRIHVVEAQTGLDADMMIERIEHSIDWGGRRHVTRFGCEKAPVVGNYAVWGAAVWGSSTWGF